MTVIMTVMIVTMMMITIGCDRAQAQWPPDGLADRTLQLRGHGHVRILQVSSHQTLTDLLTY